MLISEAENWKESNPRRCPCCAGEIEWRDKICGHCGPHQSPSARSEVVTGGGALVLVTSALGMLGSAFVILGLFNSFLDPDHASTWRVGVAAAARSSQAGGWLLAAWCVILLLGGLMVVAGRVLHALGATLGATTPSNHR